MPFLGRLLGTFRIMRDDLDLDTHRIFAQLADSDGGPNRLVIRHPLAEVAHHGAHGLVAQRQMVRVDPEDLRPALPTSVPQVQVHVRERLVDFFVQVVGDVADRALGFPPA